MRRTMISIFSISLAAAFILVAQLRAQTVSDLVSFSDAAYLGYPALAPAQGRDPMLYGPLASPNGAAGAIIDFPKTGGIYNILLTLNYSDGWEPTGGLTLGTDGNFYGTTVSGGSFQYGVLFKISPQGTYTVLHNFGGGTDGLGPTGAPIEATDGNFYGTTYDYSTVYRYTRSGVFSTIYTFDQIHGSVAGGIVQGFDGSLYVTAVEGGKSNNGTIVNLSLSGKFLGYYAFPGGAGGTFPNGPLIKAPDGNYYGTTEQGGIFGNSYGSGTVFKMTPSGTVTTLYKFCAHNSLCPDGFYPSSLMLGSDNKLYGVTSMGGSNFYGTIFNITTKGELTTLYSFDPAIGENPVGLMQDTNGRFYGSAFFGGAYGYGAIYSLDMSLPPFVAFVQATGKADQSAQILGQKLTGTTSVTFNGLPATSFKVVSDTYMTAVVPTGATTGSVVVTTPTGVLTSNIKFRIIK
jgi:uncharacterized repeat protein (TIGR03803 family)